MSSLHKKQYFLKSNSGVDRVTDGLDVNGEDCRAILHRRITAKINFSLIMFFACSMHRHCEQICQEALVISISSLQLYALRELYAFTFFAS